MSRFRKSEKREVPTLNTSALPDLIFTCLFFFMIVTHFRPVSVMTQLELPVATELQKLEEKSLLVYIMIGHKDGNRSSDYDIQLNSLFVSLKEMPEALKNVEENVAPEDRNKRMVVMRVDKDVPMGLVGDIKKILREAGLLTIHYSANKQTRQTGQS
ncbi:MAG: biopolymer transporter ExbD [Dysgonamonadaceae bacterium]|jgi:biopolymer transport protein ExbD|nr:biopolymer transporter ExbD [Dysgonamonadaceae bacterium]